MAKHGTEVKIFFIVFLSAATLYFFNSLIVSSKIIHNSGEQYQWIGRGIINIIGYATVIIPGYFVYKFIQTTNYLDKGTGGRFGKLIRFCFEEDDILDKASNLASAPYQRTPLEDALLLIFYFAGLQVSFLTWGILQEKVMTQKYVNGDKEGHFKDSQFLVFVNRVLAFLMSGITLMFTRQPRTRCPTYKYAFCSVSNILSSWCQYEALKYVSFPHQVLAKASKPIPVMIMGKIVSKQKYEYYEYLTAVILSIGMLFFMVDTGSSTNTITTISGVILLILYIIADSFTANWQGTLFKQYRMSPVQMMCAVNLFSCIFTSVSLMQQGSFTTSIKFMTDFPPFIIDCLLISICSAAGQLFIFKTLSAFGAVVFAIISTVRQGLAVLLSCLIYDHHIDPIGVFGITLVFLSIFIRIYCWYRVKQKKNINSTGNLKV